MLRNWLKSRRKAKNRTTAKDDPHTKLSLEHLETKSLLTTLVVDINNPTADQPGDNLYAQIQEAVDAADQGDVIKVHSGNYEPFIVLKSHLTIREAHRHSNPVVQLALGEPGSAPTNKFGVSLQGRGITLIGFNVEVEDNTPGVFGTGISVMGRENRLIDNTTQGGQLGFSLRGSDHFLLRNSATKAADRGFSLINTHRNTLLLNKAEGNRHGYVALASGENTFRGNSAVANEVGMMVRGNSNSLFHNIAIGNSTAGIVVSGEANTLRHNQAVSNGGPGISVSGSGHSVSGNQALLNEGDGLSISGNDHTVKHNRSWGNKGWGIYVDEAMATEFRGNRCFFNILGSSNEPEVCSHRFLFFFFLIPQYSSNPRPQTCFALG